ncbi:MAG: hypothetical protein AAGD96_30545, partial [Chloroflexota bacterium]
VTTAQNAQGNPYSVVTLIHRPAYGQGSQRIRLKTDSAQNKHTEILDANRTYTLELLEANPQTQTIFILVH